MIRTIVAQSPTAANTAALRRAESTAAALETNSDLNTQQRPVNIGDVAHIVFGNTEGDGGIWISPPAVRWSYTNGNPQYLSYAICTVLSSGELPLVQPRDVYQGNKSVTFLNSPLDLKDSALITLDQTYGSGGDCALIQDVYVDDPSGDYGNKLTPQTFQTLEDYIAVTGPSGIQFTVAPKSEDFDTPGLDYTLDKLRGQGELSFTTRGSNVTYLRATISGKLIIQGVGNGLDGYSKDILNNTNQDPNFPYSSDSAVIDPSSYLNSITQRRFVSPEQYVSVRWNETQTFTAAEDGFGGQYEVTFNNPEVPAPPALYPPNQPLNHGLSSADVFARAIVNSLSGRSYTGERDPVYIGSGTTINVVLDSFSVRVTEQNTYYYPIVEIPEFNGCGGTFDGLTILHLNGRRRMALYQSTELLDTAQEAFYQVHVYIRKGILVDRLIDGTRGSSNLFPDLAYYLLKLNTLVPDDLIDVAGLKLAAQFTEAEGLFFNGVVTDSVNLRDYLTRMAPYFMLRFTQNNGRFSLVPELPAAPGTYEVSQSPVVPTKVFDETNITEGSLARNYVEVSERKPFCAVILWRQQKQIVPGRVRSLEVRYTNTALNGPYEQYDLSEFCTSQAHAQKIGKYMLAKRKYTTHTVTFNTNPLGGSPAASLLQPGDIIKIIENRINSAGISSTEQNFYQIDSISEALTGDISIEATHFPTLSTGASAVAYDVLTGSYSIDYGYC